MFDWSTPLHHPSPPDPDRPHRPRQPVRRRRPCAPHRRDRAPERRTMAKVLYTAHAHVTGGRDGPWSHHRRPTRAGPARTQEMGGDGRATNPEQLFAVGYVACFESALAAVARRRRLDAGEVAIDSAVSLLPTGDRGFKLAVILDVTLPAVSDRETVAQLIREAHQVCRYSNATRGNIDVTLQLQDESLCLATQTPQRRRPIAIRQSGPRHRRQWRGSLARAGVRRGSSSISPILICVGITPSSRSGRVSARGLRRGGRRDGHGVRPLKIAGMMR